MAKLDPSWRQLGQLPIAGGDPFGTDPQTDTVFESVEAEIDKLQTGPAAVNWGLVAEAAAQVLNRRAKDWRMACRLAVALYQTNRFQGLAVGLTVLRDLIDESRWDRIYPPLRRAKMRGAYLAWVAERLAAGLEREGEPAAEDAGSLTEAVASIRGIDARLGAALGDFAPVLSRVIAGLEGLQAAAVTLEAELASATRQEPPAHDEPMAGPQSEPAEQPKPDAREVGGGPSAPAASAAASTEVQSAGGGQAHAAKPAAGPSAPIATAPIQLTDDVVKALRDIKNATVAVAGGLRQARLADPRPYAMLRCAIWMDLERMPPSDGGLTQVPEPSSDRQRYFEQLQQKGDWATLVLEVEKSLGSGGYYWLDGHRLVANALEALGPAYDDARRAVVQPLGALLRRFPGIERLKFAQGSGFADDLTLSWIAAEVAPAAASSGAPTEAEPWREAAAQAAALAVKGKLAEGLALLHAGVTSAQSGRERFSWHLAQARLCAEAGLHGLAVLQIEYLESLVAAHRLEEWDPGLAVDVAEVYLQAEARGPGRPPAGTDGGDLHSRMLARLCRHDVVAALAIQNK